MKPPNYKRLSVAFWVLATLVLVVTVDTAHGYDCEIDVGHSWLAPNRAGQDVHIWVTGGTQVSGMDFCAQIGDGGPELLELGLPEGTDGPAFTEVDLRTGTIFGSDSTQQDPPGIPQVIFSSIITNGGSVAAVGLLATLTIDTTGFNAGTWDLLLKDVLPDDGSFDTNFAPTEIVITNGSISIAKYGDCTLDDQVDESDVAIVAANWLRDDAEWEDGDFNGDHKVNGADVAILVANLQPAQSVPEPASIVTLGICVLIGIAGRGFRLGSAAYLFRVG